MMRTKEENIKMDSTRYIEIQRISEEIEMLGETTCIADWKKHAELYWKMVEAVEELK